MLNIFYVIKNWAQFINNKLFVHIVFLDLNNLGMLKSA